MSGPADAPTGRLGTALVGPDGTVLACDAVWRSTIGAGTGDRLAEVVHPEDRGILVDALAATDERFAVVVRTGRTDGALISHLLAEGVHRDGVWYVIGLRTFQPSALDGRPVARDPLTGLLDRAGLADALGDALDRTASGDAAALLLLDLDGFKSVNDGYGHPAGDRLLAEVGAAVRGALRAGDVAARYGGDEFAVVLRRTTPREARVAAERIVGAVGRARAGELGPAARVGASAGLVLLRPREPLSAEEALTRADLALYAAKGSAAGGVVEYPGDPEAATRLRVRLTWGRRLQRALEDDAFVVYAQPVVDLRTGLTIGREAHLHLHDGDEYVPRDGYAVHALRAGLLERLDRRLLERALASAGRAGADALAVSVGIPMLADGAFPAEVADVLHGHGVAPQRLVLGVADTRDADVREQAALAAEALARLGVRLMLDGFGTGLGAPATLRALPFAAIRLDPLFAVAADATPLDDAVVRQAVELGETFGLDVIATGADEPEDVERLHALGVQLAAGAALGPPVPIDAAAPTPLT